MHKLALKYVQLWRKNRSSFSWKIAQDSVRSPLLAPLLTISMNLAFLVQEHTGRGGTSGTVAWNGRRHLNTVKQSCFSAVLSIPPAPSRTSLCQPWGTSTVGILTHSVALMVLTCPASAAAWSSCKFLHQISWKCLWGIILVRHCPDSRLDYLRNILSWQQSAFISLA